LLTAVGWTGGTSNTPFYDGQFFADSQDVIVVTLNFRMNIFGYPGAPGYTQNLGLLDQRRAVEWVRDNIAAFGGTPSKITIVGQSSGAVAADMWAYAYRTDPIVSGLISHSGNALSFPVNTPATSAANWYNVSLQVGCGGSGDVMKCMRSLPSDQLRAAAAAVRPPPSDSVTRSIPAFQPTPDNRTVFADYPSLSQSGAFARIPYVAGTTDNETGYYKISTYGTNNTTAPDAAWQDFLLQAFWCPAYVQAWNRVKHDVSAWRFMYAADWDNLRLYPGSGAYHGSDVNLVIGNSEAVSGLPPSADQVKLTKVVMEAWAAFAEDPVDGLTKKMGWPKYYLPGTSSVKIIVAWFG
jgi:carboxylesterase type B